MEIETLEKVKKPKIELHPEHKVNLEKQVIVRSWLSISLPLRIWPTTYLICNQTGKRSKLIYTENIAKYPYWKRLMPGERFVMVFEALPDKCLTFDLYEDIPEPGEFHIKNILRNKLEVYDVPIT